MQNTELVVVIADDANSATRARAEDQVATLPRARVELLTLADLMARLRSADCGLLVLLHDSEVLEDGDEILSGLRAPVLWAR